MRRRRSTDRSRQPAGGHAAGAAPPLRSLVAISALFLLVAKRRSSIHDVGVADPSALLPQQACSARAIDSEKAASLVVTRQDSLARLGLHGRDSYIVLYNVMKSVSAALIVLAIAHIVGGGRPDFPLIPLLVASLLAVVQTYLATTIGSHLLPGRIAIPDVALPVLLIFGRGLAYCSS